MTAHHGDYAKVTIYGDDRSIYVEDANGTVYLARPVARIVDQPLGVGADWLVDYDGDPTLDDGVLLYVLDRADIGGDTP